MSPTAHTDLITVITCAHNSERFLPEAIESVLAQTYPHWELILVNDASTDETPAIMDRHAAEDERVRVIHNPDNLGNTRSRNLAVRAASGEYIAILDSDDVALPERLERSLAVLKPHPDAALVGGPAMLIEEHGEEIGPVLADPCDECDLSPRAHLAHGANCFVHSSVLMRRSALLALDGYDEFFKYAQDFDLWLRFSDRYDLIRLDEPLVSKRLYPDSISCEKQATQNAYAAVAYQRWYWKQRGRHIDLEATLRRALQERDDGRDGRPEDVLHTIGLTCFNRRRFRLARRYFLRAFAAAPWRPRSLVRAFFTLLPHGGELILRPLRERQIIERPNWREGPMRHDRHVDPAFID